MLSPPRVRHRRKEAAALAGIIVAVVALVTFAVFAIVYQLA